MLVVKPIPDRDAARALSGSFGRDKDESTMAYFAVEAGEDGKTELLGLCLFSLKDEKNEILSLDYAEGTHDDEAMIIMARTVLNFMYRCEVKKAYISDSVDPELVKKLGFRREGNRLALDLEEFYKSPCGYGRE